MSTILNCLCPSCGEGEATTICLPTKVPFFRQIIIMSLTCPSCGFSNSEVSFGGEIQPKGVRTTLKVTSAADLNRQVIKSDSCTILLPSLQFEIPPITQRGAVTTIEGVLKKSAEGLQEGQAQRAIQDISLFTAIQKVIESLLRMAGDVDSDDSDEEEEAPVFPYELVVDDPAGNSYIENFLAPAQDPQLTSAHYIRTPTQDMSIGLQPSAAALADGTIDNSNPLHKNKESRNDEVEKLGREEVMTFPTTCPHCNVPATTNMCVTNIPHFKEIIIMSLDCEKCGYKSNEIKGGGAIPKFGTKVSLTVSDAEDFGREVLKSDTAGIAIPELELELEEGSLDGVYSTVEGLLKKLVSNMEAANPFASGDSSKKHHVGNDAEGGKFGEQSLSQKYDTFMARLRTLSEGKSDGPFTLIINDPLSNSFVGPPPSVAASLALKAEEGNSEAVYSDYKDPRVEIVEYVRSQDQDDILGISDLKTEGYNEQIEATGTDQMQELSDRLTNVHKRGPDHPNIFGKPEVEGDDTKYGEDSVVWKTGSGRRGEKEKEETGEGVVYEREMGDGGFEEAKGGFEGKKEGKVFKMGAKGLGYYSDLIT
ncbi:hypothetical protein TrVE_jg7982 [Triparma verrucosa]|uniref:Zinc finger ZPR1-type domain-containing protein n=1 Tax=Triparma verrucosa TaxID=1606542 RepID=A0A9W7EU16_9STRA|nr:hypothetical protein TrVE_jg7982 [Triparma verrucosa]